MLKVVHNSGPVAGHVEGAGKGVGLEQAAMAQQHVGHLQHRRHMNAAAGSSEVRGMRDQQD